MLDDRTAAYGAFVLRVTLGGAALAHGLLKLLVFGPAGTIGFFASLGYPAALAWLVILAETVGGLLLIGGVYARVVAAIQIPVLVGATMVHAPNGWLFSSPNGGWEYPAFWAAALLALVLLGPGAHAVRDVGLARPATA